MQTPSLGRRIVGIGAGLVGVLVIAFNVLAFVALRGAATRNAESVLRVESAVVTAEASRSAPRELAKALGPLGIRAVIRDAHGNEYESHPRAGSYGTRSDGLVTREVDLGDGATASVSTPSGYDSAFWGRLVAAQIGVTGLLVALAALLLHLTSEVALAPLDRVAAAAGRTAGGRRGERLRPDRPDTGLGRVAEAYDATLDALEGSQEENARLAAVVESSDEAIISTDLEGKVLSWNPGAERMYGYTAEEAVGRQIDVLVGSANDVGVLTSLGAVRSGQTVQRMELVRRCKNGTLIDVALTVSPIRSSDGEVSGLASVARDITEQRWMARQLDATLTALQGALDEAHEAEARTRRFLDDAAHQLRQPITSIRACAETLSRSLTTAERERLLASVVRESSRAGRLMSELLVVARMNHSVSLERRRTDMLWLCEQEAERARIGAPALKVLVSGGAGPEAGLVDVDPDAVAEILSNLLHNACRFARSRIEVEVERDEAGLRVRVTDDGPGLPEGQAGIVFERFVSLDPSGGSGLGLAIARQLARAHGGDLTWESRAFVLRIPTADTEGPTDILGGPLHPAAPGPLDGVTGRCGAK